MDINIYLVFLGVTIALNLFLGGYIFYKSPRNASSQLLFLFCISNGFWTLASYVSYMNRSLLPEEFLIIVLRSVLFFAVLQSLSFYLLMKVYPEENWNLHKWDKRLIIPFSFLVSFLAFTDLYFKGLIYQDGVSKADINLGIGLFGFTSVLLVGLGMRKLLQKLRIRNGGSSLKSLVWGVLIMFASIIIFNFLYPVFLGNEKFTPMSTIFTIPFVVLTFYGILRYKVFNIKIVTTELAMITLWLLTFVRIFFYNNLSELFVNLFLFLSVVGFGLYLIKSVGKEISEKEKVLVLNKKIGEQNKKIELQKASLQELLKVKDETLHIVNHQLNTPLSVIKSATSMFQDKIWDQEKFLKVLNSEISRVSDTIAQFLAAKKAENGNLTLNKTKTDFSTLVKSLIDEKMLLKKVRETNIKINFAEAENIPPVTCDVAKITEVISNLLDNAINYSMKDIDVSLKLDKKNIILSVKDSGIGIPPESVNNLFQRFSRLENAKKTRPDGTGLGLYVCKQIVEGHGGKIWVESKGVGTGSTFFVSLPV